MTMRVIHSPDFLRETNDWLRNRVMQPYAARHLYLAYGHTFEDAYIRWNNHPHPALGKVTLHQLDEIIEGPKKGAFAQGFRTLMPNMVVHPPALVDGAALAMLGMGYEWHVCFHELGIPSSFRFGEVCLLPDSAERIGVAPGTRALTLGVAALMEMQAILVGLRGKEKWEIFQRAPKDSPIRMLFGHPDITILTDQPR